MPLLDIDIFSGKLLELVQRFVELGEGCKEWHSNLAYTTWIFFTTTWYWCMVGQ